MARLSLGGPITGIIFGVLVMFVTKIFKKGTTLYINLIVLSSYAVFFISEVSLGVSGILALVSLGLILNYKLRTIMTNK